MKVTAQARRSGGWWAIEVPEAPGAFTQTRRLDQVEEAAIAAVADLLEIDAATVEVTVCADLGQPAQEAIAAAVSASATATAAQTEASRAMRAAVATLRNDAHLTTRDAATLLGVTHQRVAQLDHQ